MPPQSGPFFKYNTEEINSIIYSQNEFQMMHRYNGYCSFSPGGGPDGKIMEKETPPVKGMFPFLHQMLPCIFRCIICNMGRIVSGCVPFTCSGIPTGSCRYAS